MNRLASRVLARLERLRFLVAVLFAKPYLNACVDEIMSLRSQLLAERDRRLALADSIAAIQIRYDQGRKSYCVQTWVIEDVVSRWEDMSPKRREMLKSAVEALFRRHINGAFTSGAPIRHFKPTPK